MFTQLRTRLLISSLGTIAIVAGLIIFVVLERISLNAQIDEIARQKTAAGQARELSLYVQYNAHDTNAYTLGHLEHSAEFVEHAAAFTALLAELEGSSAAPLIKAQIAELRGQRAQYDAAAQALFTAADAQRAAPSERNQALQDAAWERADVLGDELDDRSQQIAGAINSSVTALQAELTDRNRGMIIAVVALSLLIAALIAFIQTLAGAAVGKPLRSLLAGVEQFTAGDQGMRVPVGRQDELGRLATAFNTMATTIQAQTTELQAQIKAANSARSAAEAASAEVSSQLATIKQQQDILREISVPLLPLSSTAMVIPMVGALDSARLSVVQEQALRAVSETGIRILILDITGVPVVDTQVAQGLVRIVQAAKLLGTEVVLVGIRPEVAQAIVGLGINLDTVTTHSSLQSGIDYALHLS